jgi:hypothetical protein
LNYSLVSITSIDVGTLYPAISVNTSSKSLILIVNAVVVALMPSDTVIENEYDVLVSKSGAFINEITPSLLILTEDESSPVIVNEMTPGSGSDIESVPMEV